MKKAAAGVEGRELQAFVKFELGDGQAVVGRSGHTVGRGSLVA
jgi:hypothetical protein